MNGFKQRIFKTIGDCRHFLLFVLLFSILSAQQFRLPDEDIIGTFVATPDTLGISKDLSEFQRLNDVDRLMYSPVLGKRVEENFARQIGFVYVRGNISPLHDWDTPFQVDVRLGLESPTTPELNIFGRYYMAEYDENFKHRRMEFSWMPNTSYTDWRIRPGVYFSYGRHESVLIQRDIEDDIPVTQNVQDMDMTSVGFSLLARPSHRNPLNRMRLSMNYTVANSDEFYFPDRWEYSINDIEIDYNLSLSFDSFLNKIDVNAHYKYENFHTSGNIFLYNPFFSQFALHAQFSRYLWPSLLVEKSIPVNAQSKISLSNFPFMRTPSKSEFFNDFGNAIFGHDTENEEVRYIEYATQIPLNASISYSIFNPAEMIFGYNIQRAFNYYFVLPFFDISDGVLLSDPMGYAWQSGDAWMHTLNFILRSRVNNFTFGLDAMFMLSELDVKDNILLDDFIKIPWEPHLKLSPSIAFRYRIFSTELVGDGLFERYDTNEDKLDDVFILSLRNNFNLHRNFKMGVNINNIFDMQYQRVSGMPKEGFNAEVVMRVLF